MRGGETRIIDLERALLSKLLEYPGQSVDRSFGAALGERPAELREAPRFADHQTPQLQEPRLHHHRELAAGEIAESHLEVAAVIDVEDDLVDRVADLVDRRRNDLNEQPLLVVEVLVDRLLRDRGQCGDLVHAGPEVSLSQEYGRGRRQDCPMLAGRLALVDGSRFDGSVAHSSMVLDSLVLR
jgi:hypothetical protein